MRDAAVVPKISKWPFLVGDALLLWTACFMYIQSKLPISFSEMALACGCVALGAVLAILPFVLEYRAIARLAEADHVSSLVGQISDLKKVAGQISDATGRWQLVQEESEKTVSAAKSIGERMTGEIKAFSEFMQKVNDTEKSTLRLEVDKLRRTETDWLQALVRMLDHVHALHAAGMRSGQPRLVEQLTQFQNACRESARRVGLVAFTAEAAEPFDPQRHQWADANGQTKAPVQGAKISESVATGYTFQGRLLRPVLVRVADASTQSSDPKPDADQLSLGGMQGT